MVNLSGRRWSSDLQRPIAEHLTCRRPHVALRYRRSTRVRRRYVQRSLGHWPMPSWHGGGVERLRVIGSIEDSLL
jgi:hypothetical protein